MVDEVVVMTVNPGFGGQTFLDETLPKIAQLHRLIADRPIDLIVDGGINADTLPRTVAAGADVMVVGSAVFHAASIEAGLIALRQSLDADKA